MQSISQFLIAATSSGSGKTTLTLGLLRALRNRQLAVRPCKCGPDYIDTKFHRRAAGVESINLDMYLSSTNHVKYLYAKYAKDMDVCITEGVMGLFDGYKDMQGSSAQVAELLNLPIVLVINAKSMAYSAAAMLYGFKCFYKNIRVVGAIFNFVGSESHYQFLKEACQDVGIEALGYLPKNTDIEIPSRHLGLSIDEDMQFESFADKLANMVEKYIDVDRLLEITKGQIEPYIKQVAEGKQLKIAVAKDAAFNFVYAENIARLSEWGDVTYFSPLVDKQLPEADFVYLPGGYPELYLQELTNNKSMLTSIKQYVENGGKLLAECGGMMYVSASVKDKEGKEYPMVGILNQVASMQDMRLKLGYRTMTYLGETLRGHEFHYSRLEANDEVNALPMVQYNARGQETDAKLFGYKNMLASYTHLYWGELDLMKLFDK